MTRPLAKMQNILIDKSTAELIHIDLGIAFEQGKILPTPERIPFRLTQDIVDGFGPCGVEGTFRRSCEVTLNVLKAHRDVVMTLLEVLMFDPLRLVADANQSLQASVRTRAGTGKSQAVETTGLSSCNTACFCLHFLRKEKP